MKNSGDKTTGKTTLPLLELCKSIVDCPHSSPVYINEGKLVIRNYNIKNGRLDLSNKYYTDEDTFKSRNRRATPAPGDLIITREAPMGEVCQIPEGVECCLGQRMVLIKPDLSKCDSRYLLYSLTSNYLQKQIRRSENTGSIVSNLRLPLLRQLEIPIVSLSEQQKIASVLSTLDRKIELNNQINAELEAMAKLLYDYWFVQFDFPNENRKPYKSSGGKMVYNERLKRDIPEGWEASTISDWIKNGKNGDWGKAEEQGNYTEKVSCIRGADINGLKWNRRSKIANTVYSGEKHPQTLRN